MPTAIAQTSHIKREKEGKLSKERKKKHIETTEIQLKRSKIAQVSGKDTQQVAKPEVSNPGLPRGRREFYH